METITANELQYASQEEINENFDKKLIRKGYEENEKPYWTISYGKQLICPFKFENEKDAKKWLKNNMTLACTLITIENIKSIEQ